MDETRSVKISIVITQYVADQLNAFAQQHRWSRSTAAAILIESGLAEAGLKEGQDNDNHAAPDPV